MKPSQITKFIEIAIESVKSGEPVNICFSGAPGLGKSAIVSQTAKALGYEYLDVRLAQMEAPDVRGIQREIPNTGRLQYLIPNMWPSSGKVIINLDEVNRAPRANMNAVMQILQERRVGDLQLSKDAVIVACINEGPEYDTNEMDPALKDRFLFVPVDYDHEDFLAYATERKFHPDILGFLKSGLWVYKTPAQLGEAKYMANRSWSRLNSAYTNSSNELRDAIVKLELGADLSAVFFAWKNKQRSLTLKDFLEDEETAFSTLKELGNRQDLLVSLVLDMGLIRADKHLPLYGKIMSELPSDLIVQVWYDQFKKFSGDKLPKGQNPGQYLKENYVEPLFSKVSKKFRDRARQVIKLSDEACAKKA